MRRIGRWMLNALTVLSLLLCVGTCMLWVQSNRDYEAWVRQGKVWAVAAAAGRGMLTFHVVDITSPKRTNNFGMSADDPTGKVWVYLFNEVPMEPGVWSSHSLPGLHWRFSNGSSMVIGGTTFSARYDIYASFRLVTFLTALLPLTRFVLRQIPRRTKAGLCRACSYDLTGNVSGVCPECGRKIAEAK